MKILRRGVVTALFAALVVALLWFQGILFRHEPETAAVPPPPRLEADARTARVERRTLGEERVFPGFVEAVDPAPVAPRVMAAILALDVRESDPVTAGQVIAKLDDRDARTRLAQAEAARAAAGAGAVQAELAFERAERLLADEALTTAEWEGARAARDAAAARVEQADAAVAEATAALSWFEVRAPFDGVVLARHAEPGQLAAPGHPLVTLYRPDRLRFAVAVPVERAARVAVGDELALELEGERVATVARVLPDADRRTGTVTLHLALAEPALRPGQLGRLRLATGTREALVVPFDAIERVGQLERVRLVRDDRVVPQTVRTGKRHGDDVEVLSGLGEGEEVVRP